MKLTKDKVKIDEHYFIVTVLKRGQPCEVKSRLKTVYSIYGKKFIHKQKKASSYFQRVYDQVIKESTLTRRWREHVKGNWELLFNG